jgi:tetratricopeptide (TPR) repeat protein
LGKFVRRHRLAVAAATLVAVALILGIVGTSIGMVRAAREAEASRQVTNFLVDLFEVSDPGEARGNTVTARELLDEGARRMASELQDQPLLKARLMHTIGGVYENLGLYDQAAPLQEEALELRRASLGGDHPEVGRSLDALGNVYSLQANYQEAERLQRQAVSVLEQTVGPDHPDLAEALTHLALTSYFLDRLDEAESYYRRALVIREAALGPDHPDVAVSLAHLGFLYTNQERFEEAEPLLSRALSIRETTLGSDHFLVAESMDLLAELFFLQGRNEEAEDLWLRGLAVRQLRLGQGLQGAEPFRGSGVEFSPWPRDRRNIAGPRPPQPEPGTAGARHDAGRPRPVAGIRGHLPAPCRRLRQGAGARPRVGR